MWHREEEEEEEDDDDDDDDDDEQHDDEEHDNCPHLSFVHAFYFMFSKFAQVTNSTHLVFPDIFDAMLVVPQIWSWKSGTFGFE